MDARHRALATNVRADSSAATVADGALSQPRYQPVVSIVVVVAAGIASDRYAAPILAADLPPGLSWFALWWCLTAACLVMWWVAWGSQHATKLAVLPLFLAAAFSFAAWHHYQWDLFGRYDASRYANIDPQPVCVEAVALESPRRVSAPRPTPLRAIPGSERSRLTVSLLRIRDGKSWRPASGRCQLMVEGHLLGVRSGDRLRIFGQFARISPPQNPGEFDFAAHARGDRELVRMRSSVPESVTVLAAGKPWTLWRIIDAARAGAQRLVRTFVGPERADLASAILLGSRDGLTRQETEPYLLTGTIHVLVVSGMNVTILAAGLYFMMRMGWLSRRAGLSIIMLVVIGYALVAEGEPPVARAAIFAVLLCIGAWTGRSGVAFNTLAFAALLVLAWNPADLFRAGPQLSFLAVAGLIWIGNWEARRRAKPVDPLDRLIAATRPWPQRVFKSVKRFMGWLLITSFVVWLVTLPLLLNQFNIVSPVSVLISPAIWAIVIVVMWSGFLMFAVGWLFPMVGAWFGSMCGWSLGLLEGLVQWAESIPAAHFWAPGPAWWWVLVFYAALLAVMIRGRLLVPPRWQVAALGMWVLVGLAPPLLRAAQRDSVECSFVSVGHGTCVVLQSPTGETLLYDAGSLGSPEFATETIASYLWHRGIMRIDGIVISHADIDHYNAVPGLLERFSVGAVYVSPMMFDGFDEADASGPRALLEAIRARDVPIREVWAGDRLRMGGGLTLDILHPSEQGVVGSDNANSLLVAAEYAGRCVMLPGDLETPGIEEVTAELPRDCDVLLAPHHGSRFSDPPGFAAWSTPEWVVISGGGGDDLRTVTNTYEEANAQVMLTHRAGLIHFAIHEGPIEVRNFLARQSNE